MFIKRDPDGNDGGGAVAEAAVSTTTAPQSEAPSQSSEAQQVPAQAQQPVQPQTTDWRSMELPPQAHSFGRTTGDLLKRFQDSSREAHRLRDENRRYQEQIREFEAAKRSVATQQQNQSSASNAPSVRNNFFGYGSTEAYNQAWERDPESVMQQVVRWAIKNDPELRKELHNESQLERLAKLEELSQAQEQTRREAIFKARAEEYHAQHPEIRANPHYLEAAQNYVEANHDEIVQLLEQFPDLNLTKYVCERAVYPIMRAELEAAKKQHDGKRAASATATSGGARSVPKDVSTIEGRAAQIYEISQKEGNPMSHEEARAQAEAMYKHRIFGR